MDFLSNLATLVFILIFLLLVAHPRISLAPYIDVFLWAGVMSGCASLINGAGTYTINGILFKCIVAVLSIIFCWRLFKRQLIVTTLALPLLAHFGKKLMQPELHPPQLSDFTIQPLAKIPSVSASADLAWMIEAKKHAGLREDTSKTRHNGIILGWLKTLGAWWKDDETAWCGVFTAHCLRVAGVKYPKHWYRALDYVNYGAKLTKPAYGCIAVKTRNGGGHVCFVVGRDKKTGKLVCLGGNQNNMVCYALYNESDFQAFMWYGVTSRPADHRYDLPVLDNVRATAVTEA